MSQRKIKIETENFEIKARLLEEKRPETCKNIWEELPFEGAASVYKEEIYFDIPTEIEPEKASMNTQAGDISYWPEGPAFCIFFGESKPVSPVNTFARVEEGIEKFEEVTRGEKIKVHRS